MTSNAAIRSLAGLTGFVAILLIVWAWVIGTFAVPAFIMPGPAAVGATLWQELGQIGMALLATVHSAVLGLVIATVLALLLAAAFTASDLATRAFLPLVIGLRTAPVLAIAPILMLIFGRGLGTSLAVVVIVGFFPIMVNAMRGFRAVDPPVLELMHVAGARPWQIFLKVRLPTAIPFIMTGLRAASAGALLGAMLAEWLSGAPGLGTLILDAHSYRQLDLLWAAVLTTTAAAFLLFSAFATAEHRLTSWRA